MRDQYDDVLALQKKLTLADLWLEGMATAASGAGLTVRPFSLWTHRTINVYRYSPLEIGDPLARVVIINECFALLSPHLSPPSSQIQYCMPYPHDVLAAAWLPTVTNIRATADCKQSKTNKIKTKRKKKY